MWWGIFFMALGVEHGVWSIFSPVTITIFLLKFSGIPILKKQQENDPEFQEYGMETNAFSTEFQDDSPTNCAHSIFSQIRGRMER